MFLKKSKAISCGYKSILTRKMSSKGLTPSFGVNTSLKLLSYNHNRVLTSSFMSQSHQIRNFSSSTAGDESGFNDDFKKKYKVPPEESLEMVMIQVKKDLNADKIVLFMKGKPEQPMCGFSKRVADLLMDYGYRFSSFNVLQSPLYREALKKVSNWPTFPQVFVNGNLIGGCDIMMQLHKDGSLGGILEKSGASKMEQ